MPRFRVLALLVIVSLLAIGSSGPAGAMERLDPQQPPPGDVSVDGPAGVEAPLALPAATATIGCGQAPSAWEIIAPLNTARSRLGVAYVAATDKFYAVGGESSAGRDIPIEEYDWIAHTWTNRATLLTGVSNTGAATVGLYVYVPGGYSGTDTVTHTQRYNPAANNVAYVADMPAGNYAHAVVALGTRIYVLGGSFSGSAGNTNFIYDTLANTWSTGAPVPTAVQYPAAATDGVLIYLFGGNTTNITTMQIYNPGANTWSTGTPMTTGRGGPGAFYDGRRLWVVGGGWSSYLASTEYYQAGAWTAGPTLNKGTRTLGVGYGNSMAVKAGGYRNDYVATAERLVIPPPCGPGADLALDMTASPNPAQKGALFTYTLIVTNNGQDAATNVSASATMPAGVVAGAATSSAGNCFVASTVNCGLGTIAAGSSATVQIVASPMTAACLSSVTGSASVSSSSSDYFPVNNRTRATLTVGCEQACVTVMSSDVPKAIPDNNSAGVTSTIQIPNNLTLYDLNVVGLGISHSYDSNLVARLISPGNTPDTLFGGVGGSGQNFSGTILDDEASTPIADGVAPFTGSYRPASPLSVYDGGNSFGTWSLNVRDVVSGSTGTLNGWGLRACEAPQEPAPYKADLSVAVIPSAGAVMTNTNLNYLFIVSNSGPQIATNVTMNGTMPAQWSFLSGSLTQGSCALAGSPPQVDCSFGEIGPGRAVTLTLNGKTISTATCPAAMTSPAGTNSAIDDPNIANNASTSSVALVCSYHLFLPTLIKP